MRQMLVFLSHDMSARILFPRSIAASLMVVYSSGVVVVPNDRRIQRKAIFPTTSIHVAAICSFLWMRWYAASRSVLSYQDAF